MAKRPKVPKAIELQVLTRSRRRCALCFWLEGDTRVKRGQVAHLDGDRTNNALGNLAWLCQPHHDEYDSRPSQTKGLQETEVKQYRDDLEQLMLGWSPALDAESTPSRGKIRHVPLEVFDRRMAVYHVVRKFIMSVFSEGRVEIDVLRRFGTETEEALFLFDQAVASHIDALYRRALELRAVQSRIEAAQQTSAPLETFEALLNKDSELLQWFTSQLTETRHLFKKYMHL